MFWFYWHAGNSLTLSADRICLHVCLVGLVGFLQLSDMSSHVFPIFHTVLVMFLINSQLRHLICTYCFGFLLKPLCHLPWSYCFYLFILFFCSFQMCLLVDLCDTGWGKQKPLSCSNKFSLSCTVCSRQEWWNKRWTSPVKY